MICTRKKVCNAIYFLKAANSPSIVLCSRQCTGYNSNAFHDFRDLLGQILLGRVVTVGKSAMDDFDRKIIGELAANGRISFRNLGRRIHLSPNATAERVRRLQAAGFIRNFRTEFDRARLGFSIEAYVDVKMQPRTTAQAFEAAIRNIPGVVSAAILTGEFDFRLRVACKDQSDLVRLIEALRSQAGVQETSSALICREFQLNGCLP